jgi:protein-S-isoprenylcysteine O-methyltransferase Ste14
VFWLLFTLGWLACVVYSTIPLFWILIHSYAAYWRSRRQSPYLVLVPVWIAMWLAVGAVTYRWRFAVLYLSVWTWVPAVALFLTGFWLYRQSGKHFSPKQLGGLPEVLADHREQQLATSGIRARVRHPVYLAHLCEMVAWSAGTGLAVCYGLTAFAVVTGTVMIRMEDAELEQRFGEEYRKYRQSVAAIFPRI